jgi:regulatory protein
VTRPERPGGRRPRAAERPDRPASRDPYEAALGLLDVRARTTRELSQRLGRRGYSTDDIARVIERLTAAGLLDDAAYGRQFTRGKLARGTAAPARIQFDLVRRGLDRGAAASAVQNILAEEAIDIPTVLEDLARRRARTMGKLDATTRRRRLFAYLARRGFDGEAIAVALDRLVVD